MIFNVGATVLYITAFITCSAVVDLTSLKGTRPYNQRAAASVSRGPGVPAPVTGVTGQTKGCAPGLPLHPGPRPGTCHLPSDRPDPQCVSGAELCLP